MQNHCHRILLFKCKLERWPQSCGADHTRAWDCWLEVSRKSSQETSYCSTLRLQRLSHFPHTQSIMLSKESPSVIQLQQQAQDWSPGSHHLNQELVLLKWTEYNVSGAAPLNMCTVGAKCPLHTCETCAETDIEQCNPYLQEAAIGDV